MGTLLEPDDIREQLQSQLLLHYDLPEDTKVYHLKYSENFTYRLESEMTGEKYVLRVNRPGYHDLTELESELSWIRAVKRIRIYGQRMFSREKMENLSSSLRLPKALTNMYAVCFPLWKASESVGCPRKN